jgi:hypothetical protein
MPVLLLVLCLGFIAVMIPLMGCAYFLMRCACELTNLRRIALSFGLRDDLEPRRDTTRV